MKKYIAYPRHTTSRTDGARRETGPNCLQPSGYTDSAKALQMIRDATDGALEETGLVEAVAVLISQRDNARHYAETFRSKLKELGHSYV